MSEGHFIIHVLLLKNYVEKKKKNYVVEEFESVIWWR